MVKILTIDTLIDLIKDFKKDGIQFKAFSNSSTHFSGTQVLSENTADNVWTVKIALLSAIGTFYYEESFKLKDEAIINNVKAKISSTIFAPNAELSYKDGVIAIK